MSKVTLIMTASLDGYVVKPDGMAVGAMPEPPELKRWKLDRISHASTHIMGRVVYQEMKTVWPTSKDPYAAPMNDIPKVVFSKTLKVADWSESTIASGDLASEVASLRRKHDGEIIAWGGASFAQSLVRANLIDEFAIITNPVAYGGGKPLFLDLPKALELKMLASTSFSSGHLLRLFTKRDE
ncbi:dihydrofolate reductase family protein [Aquamicrobium terrae]|uniref:Dihydrofolate reductase n=1 Tax=Aquamicrobium terrae TaxID=1324945 RepID=A0ABV2N6R0_9HYPH